MINDTVQAGTKPGTAIVYVITCRGYVKIGFTGQSVESRLSNLQIGNPFRLKVAHTASVPFEARKAIERMVHRRLSPCHHRDEWFETTTAVAIEAINEAIDRFAERQAWEAELDEMMARPIVYEPPPEPPKPSVVNSDGLPLYTPFRSL